MSRLDPKLCYGCVLGIFFFIGIESIFAAQSYDLKEITPEIQQAIDSRKARYPELQQFRQRGLVGEGNQGYVVGIEDSAMAGQIVASENQDRQIIYEAIANQNQLGAEGLEQVKLIFAEVQRGKAQPGDLIQLSSGEWLKKQGSTL